INPLPYADIITDWVRSGDFNGDGKLDVVAVSSSDPGLLNPTYRIETVLGNGNGTFQPEKSQDFPGKVSDFVVGDFNGDGKQDLALIGNDGVSNVIQVLLSNSDGTFQAPVTILRDAAALHLIAGDFNGDGKQDLAVTTQYGVLRLLRGNGDG